MYQEHYDDKNWLCEEWDIDCDNLEDWEECYEDDYYCAWEEAENYRDCWLTWDEDIEYCW